VRLINVTGDISEDDPAKAEEILTRLEEVILPRIEEEHGVAWRLAGLAEQENAFLNDALVGFSLCLLGIFLTLAWIFSSWTRPIAVMVIIPFGLVGAIYGHVAWEVPLSMFSVVGLIGMTGIIINDSIVLVTTVDEYAEDRGLIPAIIDATADRLRPVLLTTFTTVIGLAPLLFERSQDAQFLKPTVITLVYGLGFGMVLVLMVVPAILAMQQDFGKQFTALKRALRFRKRGWGVGALVLVAMLGSAGIFAATLGSVIMTGELPRQLVNILPNPEFDVTMPVAFGLFALALIATILLVFVFGALGFALRRRAS
jgi:predicted RND superfamily exporter protein